MHTITQVFSNGHLADDAYYKYSDQFLSQEQSWEISGISEPEESRKIRAKILCESGKDPFSPPANSLAALGSIVDIDRVNSCFKKAHEIYQQIIMTSGKLEPARLYKLGWATEATESVLNKFDEIIWKKILEMETAEAFFVYMAELKQSEDQDEIVVHAALSEFQKNIIDIFNKQYAKSNKRKALNSLKIKKAIIENLSRFFFRPRSELVPGKSYKELQACDAVYDPKDSRGMINHSWGTNFTWVLAHIKKGNEFIICADILTNKTRAKYLDTPSAFFREVCVLLKAGYSLSKIGDNIMLKPIGLTEEDLQRCDSTGALGDGINPSYAEVDEIHRLLEVAKFSQCANFECCFEFQNGRVNMRVLNKSEVQLEQADRFQVLSQSFAGLGENFGSNTARVVTLTPEFDADNTANTVPVLQSNQGDVQPVKPNTNIPKA